MTQPWIYAMTLKLWKFKHR